MPTTKEILSVNTVWDAVIIGTGMGGAAMGYGLARHGLKVLFLEKGEATQRLGSVPQSAPMGEQMRLARGWWPSPIETTIDGEATKRHFPLGCGVGGSTLMYGAALERLDPRDFEPARHHNDIGDSLLPDLWPVTYKELEPYYAHCEKLFNVCGTKDPLRVDDADLLSPPQLNERDQSIFDRFEKAGLSPYRIPVSIDYKKNCGECIGFACARSCKKDAENVLLDPALEAGAALAIRCSVTKILANAEKATGVICEHDGETFEIQAKTVVLAAGALASPALLLSSANEYWPDGLANTSDMVGRCLMFHIGNQFAVWGKGKAEIGPRKTIALKDFYVKDGIKFGAVQAVGVPAGRGNIQLYLRQMLGEAWIDRVPLFNKFLGVVSWIAEKIFGKAAVYTAMLEDLPYRDNKVIRSDGSASGFKIEYHIREELKQRAHKFRTLVTRAMKFNRTMLIDRSVRLNYGHPIGTVRAGADPAQSVLRYDNRTHDLENLYVVDGSFFPSSGGVNPSLTIAANALRVADIIGKDVIGAAERTVDIALASNSVAPSTDGKSPSQERAGREKPGDSVQLSECVVVITGAGAGLGKALALGFAGDGATVVAIGRRDGPLQALKDEASDGKIIPMVGDVANPEDAPRLIAAIEKQCGRVDILINNAALYRKGIIEKSTVDDWWGVFETNILGPMAMTRAAMPVMRKNHFGRVIMVGSFADRAPLPGSSSYAVTKGAMHTLTMAFAEEVNRGAFPDIAINEFIPAPMKTGMGSAAGIDPRDCYPWIKSIVTQPAHGAHGAIFFKDQEQKPPKSLKRRLFEKLPFVKKT